MLRKNPIQSRILECAKKIEDLEDEIGQMIRPYLSESSDFYSVDFLWGCDKSPFGLCVYHKIEDPAHDNCIFCNEPQERK